MPVLLKVQDALDFTKCNERKNIKLEEKSIPAAWMYLFNKVYGQVISPVLANITTFPVISISVNISFTFAINDSTYLSLQNLTSQQRKLASSLKHKNPAKAVTQIAAMRKSES